MQKYHVTLKSPVDDQARFVTLSARSEDEARIRAEAAELEYVDYDLYADRFLAVGHGAEGMDVDTAANRSLAKYIERECSLTDAGKARGPSGRARAKYHQHVQQRPFVVASVEAVRLSDAHVDRLVRELAALQHDEEAWKRLLDTLRDNGTPLAVLGFQYGVPKKNQYDGTAVVDWDTDTIKCSLHTAHTPDQDTHDFFNDVSATEVSGTGYTAGGATLASKTATYDTASDQVRLDAADTSWASSTISAQDAIVRKDTGTAATSPLMGHVDFEQTVSTTNGTFQITWDSTGIIVDDLT